ncbi:MAG: hypothetical protein ACRENP_06700 [Longimicrobiales bacterium]
MIRGQRSLIIAACALSGACLAFGYTLVRAVVVVPMRSPETGQVKPATAEQTPPAPASSAKSASNGRLSRSDLMLAVDHDPFRPDRQRPPERYRMPGEEIVEEEPPPPPPPPPPFRVLGTIVTPEGGVAVIETQGSVPRVVGVGESLFGFRLAAVNPSTATVEGNGGRNYSLQIEQPSQTRNARGGRGGPARTPADAARQQNEARERQVMEMMERVRATGVNNPQAEQMLQDLLRRNFPNGRGIGSVEVVRGANGQQQMIIRPRPDTMIESGPQGRNR